ncbi:SNF2 family N-terminal domain-containing protein [Hypoxylon sp. FL1150]|nr:SNF2 family N-terminal domain-containing protein [Hypoxylon sp. FL1150]
MEQEICFGALCDIRIQWISNSSRQKLVSLGKLKEQDTYDINLRLSDDQYKITDVTGIPVALLNKKTHLAFSKLTAAKQIRFGGNIPEDDSIINSTAVAGQQPANGSNADSLVNLLVFGPQSVADSLAKDLSRYRLFLQHPDLLPALVPYSNPQYLPIAGALLTHGSLLPAIQDVGELNHTSDVSSSQEDDDVQTFNLADVFDHFPQHSYLKEVQVDHRISTPLLSHQKEGVDFILRRERPTPSNPRTLWKLSGLGQVDHTYRHLITGLSSHKPDDAPGGLLADAMGVGKTLTMIASIASSLENAGLFAHSEGMGTFPDTNRRHPINSTLILVPSALLLDGWIEEIKRHVIPGALHYYKYHGPNRHLPLSTSIPYHIVLTTYGTVAADSRSGGGILHSFKWYRLVLDEAHVIRNWSTKQFKAVMELDAVIRWCMTGTPIQNSLEDLATLVSFLKIPFLEDTSVFRRHIIGRKRTVNGIAKPNFENLKLLLGSICLRRSTSVLSLNSVSYTTCRPVLSPEERTIYNNLALDCKMSIDELISHQNPQSLRQRPVLEALLKMRIFCNQGLHAKAGEDSVLTRADEKMSLLQLSGESFCEFCNTYIDVMDSEDAIHLTRNQNLACGECASRYAHEVDKKTSIELPSMEQRNSEKGIFKHSNYSTKLIALLENVSKQDLQDKSIVFSAWIRSLNAVTNLFTEYSITFRRVDGEISHAKKKQMLSEFHDPSVRALLITLGTGAVGQAIGRIIKLNQKKQVYVIRYVTESTIEKMVESKQVSKLDLAIRGGLQSSNIDHTNRIEGFRELAKVIEAQLKL